MESILERVRAADTIFIPKGEREIDGAIQWLQQEAGVDVPEFGEDQLVAWSGDQQFAKLRSGCILPIVEKVENTVGFAGSTKFKNYQLGLPGWSSILRIAPIGQPKCRLALACLVDREEEIRKALANQERLVVGTEFTNIADSYAAQQNYNLTPVLPAPCGSVETYPLLGLSDVVIDLADRGKTMAAQQLIELETISKDYQGVVWRSEFMPPANENAPPILDAPGLLRAMATIQERAANVADGCEPETYSERLLASVNNLVKKYASESGEVIKAFLTESDEELVNEVADATYSSELLLAKRGLSFVAVLAELVRRNQPKA